MASWDESKHPRHPKGTAQGGEFAPKGGQSGGKWIDAMHYFNVFTPGGLHLGSVEARTPLEAEALRRQMIKEKMGSAYYKKAFPQREVGKALSSLASSGGKGSLQSGMKSVRDRYTQHVAKQREVGKALASLTRRPKKNLSR